MSLERKTDRSHRRATLSLLALVAARSATLAAAAARRPIRPRQRTQTALAASAPGELLAYVKTLLMARDAQRQAQPGVSLDGPPVPGTSLALSPPARRSPTRTPRSRSRASTRPTC